MHCAGRLGAGDVMTYCTRRMPTAGRALSSIIWALTIACPLATAADRHVIKTEADLPHTTYPLQGTVQELLDADSQTFSTFAAPVESDIDRILRDDDISDHATLINLLQAKLQLQVLSGASDKAALDSIPRIRSLQEKGASQLTTDLEEEAFLKARLATRNPGSGCPDGYASAYAAEVNALPWQAVRSNVKSLKSSIEIASRSVSGGLASAQFQASVTQTHALNLIGAEYVIGVRENLAVWLPCKQPTLAALSSYIKQHDVAKPSIWPARDAVLPATDKLTPVNVGIWDSGFDSKLFADRLYTRQTPDNDDPHGIAFDVRNHPAHGELMPLTAQEKADYPDLVKNADGVDDMSTGTDSDAAKAFKSKIAAMTPQQVHLLYDEQKAVMGYMHGTHVTGIAAQGNPVIRLAYARTTYDNGDPPLPPTDAMLRDLAQADVQSVAWFRQHKIRVVNMSWWDTPANYEDALTANGIGKDAAERKKLARHYFDMESKALFNALKSAPEILFVTIAGNSNADNAFQEVIPSSFKLPNLIVTGAVDQAGDETPFTSYGDNVAVDAYGQAVESKVPGGATVRMSGTSMAAPQVTNLAAKLLAIDPALTPPRLIELIRKGADTTDAGRLHLINPKRSVQLLESSLASQ